MGDVSRYVCVFEEDGGGLLVQSSESEPLLFGSMIKHGTVSGNTFALQSLLHSLLQRKLISNFTFITTQIYCNVVLESDLGPLPGMPGPGETCL